MIEPSDSEIYEVVINHEEQYSIWHAAQEVPLGWKKVGVRGTKDECLDHIERVWVDMRPLSVRKWLSQEQQPTVGNNSQMQIDSR